MAIAVCGDVVAGESTVGVEAGLSAAQEGVTAVQIRDMD